MCFFANFSSMQSTEAPVSGSALRVARLSSWYFLVFILILTIRVGQPAISAEFAAGHDTVKDFFFLLLFLM